MRPVTRGSSPQTSDFADYRDAFPHLVARLGEYCSYCERRLETMLAVEHIQPKNPALSTHALIGRWDNFLLGCPNCNGTKRDKPVHAAGVLLPDRDDTFSAYTYDTAGKVVARAGLPAPIRGMADDLLSLVGLDKAGIHVVGVDVNGNTVTVAVDRVAQRKCAWDEAQDALTDLQANPSDTLMKRIAKEASKSGFFSVWMTVFANHPAMCARLVAVFPGTTAPGGAFPPHGQSNPDGLPHGAKVP